MSKLIIRYRFVSKAYADANPDTTVCVTIIRKDGR